ncbi:unnamed protein product [Didymodactylos carnosus]|uniref:Uncharacterized protein n=1 Tax=Didymodactylos carnosus TaxID=1234261 RepID=A0A8S2DFC6_9BILA|nr:unnamed protein product [Didymodactylos carnosus]CAF3663746.1 unnamed protein product [Didymodactylos carnosus]
MVNDLSLDSDSKKILVDDVKRGRMYLKTDYKVHVQKSSTMADHCINYALSQSNDTDYAKKCDHRHDDVCVECNNLAVTLEKLRTMIKSSVTDNELLDRELAKLKMSTDAIEAWKCHQLRTVNQDLSRQELLQDLPANSVYILTDWAMKWLPEKYVESQEDFFAKRGLSWHISVVDNESVVAILQDVLTRIKTDDPSIEYAYCRADNAGCYHSAGTILSLPLISEKPKIKILRIDFSDPQAGKLLEETTPNDDDDTIRIKPPDRGWALPKDRKVTRLNESQIKYLTEKFHEGVQQRIRWKPEEVSAEMQRKKDLKNRFYFTPAEFLKPSQIRSFF